jgi:hypothetical protein
MRLILSPSTAAKACPLQPSSLPTRSRPSVPTGAQAALNQISFNKADGSLNFNAAFSLRNPQTLQTLRTLVILGVQAANISDLQKARRSGGMGHRRQRAPVEGLSRPHPHVMPDNTLSRPPGA